MLINVRSDRISGTMNSSSTVRTNNVGYEKLEIDYDHQVEAAPDATRDIASSSSISRADEVSERQPFRSSGFKCFGCIPLRAGDKESMRKVQRISPLFNEYAEITYFGISYCSKSEIDVLLCSHCHMPCLKFNRREYGLSSIFLCSILLYLEIEEWYVLRTAYQ